MSCWGTRKTHFCFGTTPNRQPAESPRHPVWSTRVGRSEVADQRKNAHLGRTGDTRGRRCGAELVLQESLEGLLRGPYLGQDCAALIAGARHVVFAALGKIFPQIHVVGEPPVRLGAHASARCPFTYNEDRHRILPLLLFTGSSGSRRHGAA